MTVATAAEIRSAPVPTRTSDRSLCIAFLTTEYPKVSHTFIRREILELEKRGHTVARLSIRDGGGAIADPVDREEHAKTWHCLNRSIHTLLWNALVVKVRHPLRWLRASMVMWQMHRASDRGLLRHIAYLIEAANILRKVSAAGVDHLHVHFGTNAASVARLARALGGPPYSMMIHGPDEFDDPRGHSLQGKVADAAFVAAISDYCVAQLRRWAAINDWPKIQVVHCTVSDDFFEADVPTATDSRTLVCVGRLCAQKGQLVLMDALARLRDDGVECRVVLAGDGEMRPEVETRIAELDLHDCVQITGWIAEAEVRGHLASSRGLVLPSFAEGLPVVIMEALAMGRPVISTAIAAIPELVRTGETGWLIPPANVEALADAMQDLLDADAPTRQELGEAGRLLVRERHHGATEAARLEALILASTEHDS